MLRTFQLFVAAYEERSFTAAAIREGATQSGVSQHIRKIEDKYNVQLFERDSGRVVPTPAADRYYQHCVKILRHNEAAIEGLKSFSGDLSGKLTVGLMPTMNAHVLAPALLDFSAQHPNVTVAVVEAFSGTLTQQVRTGDLDFAIVPSFPSESGLKTRYFDSTAEVIVASPESDLPHLGQVHIKDVAPLRIVLPAAGNTRNSSIRSYLAAQGVEVAQIIELDTMIGTLDLVAHSDWLAILPALMIAENINGTRFTVVRMAEPELMLDLVTVEPARHSLPPSARIFQSILKAHSVRLNEQWSIASAN